MSEEKFWESVRSSDYYRSVMGNMIGPKHDATVRFGKLGTGVAPNYQITRADGRIDTYRGTSYEKDAGLADSFAEQNLSDPYPYQDVQRFLASALERRR